jgi:hypothetical protein
MTAPAAAACYASLANGHLAPPIVTTVVTAPSARPRAVVPLGLVRRAAPKSGRLAVAEAVLAEVRRKPLPEPNIGIAVTTLARVAGMVPGAGEAVFAVARTAGYIARALRPAPAAVRTSPRCLHRPACVHRPMMPCPPVTDSCPSIAA